MLLLIAKRSITDLFRQPSILGYSLQKQLLFHRGHRLDIIFSTNTSTLLAGYTGRAGCMNGFEATHTRLTTLGHLCFDSPWLLNVVCLSTEENLTLILLAKGSVPPDPARLLAPRTASAVDLGRIVLPLTKASFDFPPIVLIGSAGRRRIPRASAFCLTICCFRNICRHVARLKPRERTRRMGERGGLSRASLTAQATHKQPVD